MWEKLYETNREVAELRARKGYGFSGQRRNSEEVTTGNLFFNYMKIIIKLFLLIMTHSQQ
jgi:hypothetical protein